MRKAKFHMRHPVLLHGVHTIPFDIYEIERYSTMMWILKVEIESKKTHFYPQIKLFIYLFDNSIVGGI
jgi:hypothetical protein